MRILGFVILLHLCLPATSFLSAPKRPAPRTCLAARGRGTGYRGLKPAVTPTQPGRAREYTMPSYFDAERDDIKVIVAGRGPMADHWARILRRLEPEEIALDIESNPTDDPEPDVLSIMAFNTVVIFHLAQFEYIPAGLCELLEDDDVIKVGCGIEDDIRLFNRWYSSVPVRGWYDIGKRAGQLAGSRQPLGVKGTGESLFGISVSKPEKISRSDWSAPRLTPDQVAYAAMDCLLPLEAYWKLYNEGRL